MSGKIFIGDTGTVFQLTVKDGDNALDISLATVLLMLFRKPDDTLVEQTAQFVTDGTDGKIYYTSTEDDLDLDGCWQLQGRVTLPTGEWSTTIRTFKVYPNLDT